MYIGVQVNLLLQGGFKLAIFEKRGLNKFQLSKLQFYCTT